MSNIHSEKVLKSDNRAILILLFFLIDSFQHEVISQRQTNLYDSNFHVICKIKGGFVPGVYKVDKNEHHMCQE